MNFYLLNYSLYNELLLYPCSFLIGKEVDWSSKEASISIVIQCSYSLVTAINQQPFHLRLIFLQPRKIVQQVPKIQPPVDFKSTDQASTTTADSISLPTERLAHGFKRTLFGFPPSFRRNSDQDRFGYLFESKSSVSVIAFSDANRQLMEELGRAMIDPVGTDDTADLSTIDSGYTYFGQFVDHDLTFDVDSTTRELQKASKLINYRTPNLDLDSVYGDGPAVDAYMYDTQGLRFIVGSSDRFGRSNPFDLPRTMAGSAIIADPRNDENLIVAQFHTSMLLFHNAVFNQLQQENPTTEPDKLFRMAQREVRRHYQWVVFHDYLRKIVGSRLIDDVLTNGPRLFSYQKHPRFFMPVEFSVAAYRFGHSQIRDIYRFNATFSNNGFSDAFNETKRLVDRSWNIHWPSFFGTDAQPAVNKARKIDTRVAMSMGRLPSAPGAPPDSVFTVLSARNLIRSMALGVPTGQYVAKRMKEPPLTRQELLSRANQNLTPPLEAQHRRMGEVLESNDGLLLRQTPLWYYILKEAEVMHDGNQLGPVGGRIVAEVFMRLLAENEDSFLNDSVWKPRFRAPGTPSSTYTIVDLLRFAGTYPILGIN